jgi:hypothetical protein
VLATWGLNTPGTKRVLDALDRPLITYVTDRLNDPAPGVSGNRAAAISVSDDNVLEQIEIGYEKDQETSMASRATGKVLLTTTRRRFHDSTDTGALTTNNSVATFVGYAYDNADRLIQTVNFGTNNTAHDIFANGSSPAWPGTVPSFAITSEVVYDSRGRVDRMIDPLGKVTKYLYDDVDRQTAVVENWQSANPPVLAWDSGRWKVTSGLSASDPDRNRVTSYVYDTLGNVKYQTAHLPPEGGSERVQITEYVYGTTVGSVSNAADSLIASADLLREVRYPDESTGLPGTTAEYRMSYAYNRLGELRSVTDQNGTSHVYARDSAGCVTEDRATVGIGTLDGTIKRIGVTYDTSGRVSKVASYDLISGGTIKNEVEYTYTTLWQISRLFQNPVGAVTRSGNTPSGDTRVVTYAYADSAAPTSGSYSAASNYSRLISLTYPKLSTAHADQAVTHGYGGSATVDDRLHRIASLSFPTPDNEIASYSRVGLGMLAVANVSGIQLDYTIVNQNERFAPGAVSGLRDGMRRTNEGGQADILKGRYAGYDRFGRVGTHIWATAGFGPRGDAHTNRPNTRQHFQENYTYDKSSNRLTRDDRREFNVNPDRHENFEYDELDRLKEAKRGVRGTSTWTPGAKSQLWALDMLGNWVSARTDSSGDGDYSDAADLLDERGAAGTSGSGHNLANELTQRVAKKGDGTSPVTLPLGYDAAGNTRTATRQGTLAGDWEYTHDAWNRLVKARRDTGSGPVEVATYTYNGLHWRTTETHAGAAQGGGAKVTRMYYSSAWQLLWEETDGSSAGSGLWEARVDATYQNAYGLRGLDDLIARRVDGRTAGACRPTGPTRRASPTARTGC